MSATATGPGADVVMPWPQLTTCDRCTRLVLRVRHARAGRPAHLEFPEVFPEGPCSACRGRGVAMTDEPVSTRGQGAPRWQSCEIGDLEGATVRQPAGDCPVCEGTGVAGEPLTPGLVLVSAAGIARPYEGGRRRSGEAAYRRHRCRGG